MSPDCWREPPEDGLWWKFTGIGDFTQLYKSIGLSAMKTHWEHAAGHFSGEGMAGGVDFTAVKRHLKHYSAHGMEDKYYALCTIASGACWPRSRKHKEDLLGDPKCIRCGHSVEDDTHFFWQCPANNLLENEDVKATAHLEKHAVKSSTKCLWNRGLPPGFHWPEHLTEQPGWIIQIPGMQFRIPR